MPEPGYLDRGELSHDLLTGVFGLSEISTVALPDDGYFPRGRSLLRQVHEEHVVGLLYGQRALCIGALAPLNYVGTAEHSYARLTPFRRLVHTGHAFEKIYFGKRAEADRVLAYVRKLHEEVRGTLPEDAGVTPKGAPYSAMDPALMLWTVAVIADSAQRFYELLVRKLSAREREALWQDYLRFGELFGMPRESAPASYGEFRAYWNAKLASEEMYLTEEARYIGYATAFEIPLPALHQPGKRVHDLLMLGSLPPRARDARRRACRDQAPFGASRVGRGLERRRPTPRRGRSSRSPPARRSASAPRTPAPAGTGRRRSAGRRRSRSSGPVRRRSAP